MNALEEGVADCSECGYADTAHSPETNEHTDNPNFSGTVPFAFRNFRIFTKEEVSQDCGWLKEDSGHGLVYSCLKLLVHAPCWIVSCVNFDRGCRQFSKREINPMNERFARLRVIGPFT